MIEDMLLESQEAERFVIDTPEKADWAIEKILEEKRCKEAFIWAKGSDGQMTPVGETYDALPIVESLMDIVINLKKSKQNEYIAEVKKSRLGNLPDILEIKSYDSICMALKEAKNKP